MNPIDFGGQGDDRHHCQMWGTLGCYASHCRVIRLCYNFTELQKMFWVLNIQLCIAFGNSHVLLFCPSEWKFGGHLFFSPMICWIRLQGQPWYCTCSFLVTRPSLPQTVILWCDDMMSVLNIPTAGSVRLEQVDITRKTALGSKSLCRDWSVCTSVHQSGSLTVNFTNIHELWCASWQDLLVSYVLGVLSHWHI